MTSRRPIYARIARLHGGCHLFILLAMALSVAVLVVPVTIKMSNGYFFKAKY